MPLKTEERTGKPAVAEIVESLSEAGYDNILVLTPEAAADVTTEKRMELISTIRANDVRSIRGLARTVDRKENVVHEDLQILFRKGVVDFEEEGNRKIPVIPHDKILVEPIL
ncbi:MAG: transcriptional regulator [Candidatus Nanohaloarchaea archaeon]|nr:transcriptional regulator [Candidatus Nanohaloarchaea archaeon]